MPFTEYYGKFQGFRGNFGGVPPWGRAILSIAAIPGVLVVIAGVLALLAGIALILLFTIPIYRVLKLLTPAPVAGGETAVSEDFGSSGRKAVESRIV